MSDLGKLVFPIGDGPWRRMLARVEAMPSGPERTQALVDMNAMLIDRRRLFEAEAGSLDVERLARALHNADRHAGPYCLMDDGLTAVAIAREYVRLSSVADSEETR